MKHQLSFPIALLLGIFTLPACVTRGEYNKEQQARKNAEEQRDQYRLFVTENEDQKRLLLSELDRLRLQVQDTSKNTAEASLERQKYLEKLNELERRLQSLGTGEASGPASSGDVSVYQTPEGTVVEIKDGVLFDSGKTDIKSQGKTILDKIADEVSKTNYSIRVEGHTDTDPIKVHAKEFPMGNLHLSAARAVEVAGYLCQKAPVKIPESRVTVAGYGPNRPKASGDTAEAKRQNRRVGIVILNAPVGTMTAGELDPHGGDGK